MNAISKGNGRVAAGMGDANTALAMLAQKGEQIISVTVPSDREPTIYIKRPRHNWLRGEIIQQTGGLKRRFRAELEYCRIEWVD